MLRRFFLLLVVTMTGTLQGYASITIDGDLSDWREINPLSTGFLAVSTISEPTGNRIREIRMTNDREHLYLSIAFEAPVQISGWGPLLIIDQDLDETTGFPCPPLGVDFLIQPSRNQEGILEIHKRIDAENNTTWSKWHHPILVPQGVLVGKDDHSDQMELKVPFRDLGFADADQAVFRFRICDGVPFLNTTTGSWAPGFRLAWFSFGSDPQNLSLVKNLCPNGDFENLMEATASTLPQNWSPVTTEKGAVVGTSLEAFSGKRSLHLSVDSGNHAGANSSSIECTHGLVHFRYKVLKASDKGDNLSFCVIALNNKQGQEIGRKAWSPPPAHVGDGNWHEASFEFDFTNLHAEVCLFAPRINENTPSVGPGEWLLDAIEVYPVKVGSQVHLVRTWCSHPLARLKQSFVVSAWVDNTGDQEAKEIVLQLNPPEGVHVGSPSRRIERIEPDSYERVEWEIIADRTGTMQFEIVASFPRHAIEGENLKRESNPPQTMTATYRTLVIDPNAHYSRQELCTDEQGYLRILERPQTLQEGNTEPLTPVSHKKSSEIKHNPYGICAHLPRARDYEDPFNANHLIDDDPETCWSSQQNNSTYPGNPPWAEIDLGKIVQITQVNLVPYWKNTDFPLGFSIKTSLDGNQWQTAVQSKRHVFSASGPRRGDNIVQVIPLGKSHETRFVRIDFERLPLSGGNYAEVSQGYKARLAGIEVINPSGENCALLSLGARATVCDYFTGWHNTAKTVNEAFPQILEIGLKWVRVGQWGDQTEWAAVERVKGQYAMDLVTDAGINTLLDNGVDILYGLNYGNSLHEKPDQPFADVGPIYTEGHPFYLNAGPRTEEGRQAFVKYVDYVVRRYGQRIKWWELWNEENGWFPGHEPELYGKLLLAVAKQIKSIDPNLKVMFGGTAAPAPLTTEIALREGAAPYLDAYAFHPYGIDKPEGGMGTMEFYQGKSLGQSKEQTGWNHLEEVIAGVRKPFAQHGNPNVEVWMNEWGTNVTGLDYTYNPGIGEFECTKYLMRFYVYGGWLELPMAWWALHNINMSQDWGVLDRDDYGFRPMSYALQNICSVVSDVHPLRDLVYHYEGQAPNPKVIGYQRDITSSRQSDDNRNQDQLVVVWAAELSNDEVKTYPSSLTFTTKEKPDHVTITDLYWGISQTAQWTHSGDQVSLTNLMVKDYPIVISCE